jgi:hypothetical protein
MGICQKLLSLPCVRAATKSTTPRDLAGPGSTLLTVMPVPETAPARPRAKRNLRRFGHAVMVA